MQLCAKEQLGICLILRGNHWQTVSPEDLHISLAKIESPVPCKINHWQVEWDSHYQLRLIRIYPWGWAPKKTGTLKTRKNERMTVIPYKNATYNTLCFLIKNSPSFIILYYNTNWLISYTKRYTSVERELRVYIAPKTEQAL